MAKILVVDDSQVMRNNLRNLLEGIGHQVIAEASDGQDGYIKYKKYNPDLVTMDITMPGLDGIQAVEKIMTDFPTARIIMVSAEGHKEKVLRALKLGAKHFIVKPVTREKIIEAATKVLGAKEEQDQNQQTAQVESTPEPEEELEPFTVQKEAKEFIVEINNSFTVDDYSELESALNVCQYIDSLKLVFKFIEIESLADELLTKLTDIMEQINAEENQIKVLATNQEFCNYLQSNDFGLFSELITLEVPFELEKEATEIKIKLNKTFTVDDFSQLNSALAACLHLRPLQLVFNCHQELDLGVEKLVSQLEDWLLKAKQAGGEVRFLSAQQEMIDLMARVAVPFEIKNKAERFVVTINGSFSEQQAGQLKSALDIFSYLTLPTVFEFNGEQDLTADLVSYLADLIEQIGNTGEKVEIEANSPGGKQVQSDLYSRESYKHKA